jgi:hypothetical protein
MLKVWRKPALIFLRLLCVDEGYHGDAFAQWVKTLRAKLKVEVVLHVYFDPSVSASTGSA